LGEAWRFFQNRRVWLATYWAAPVYRLWLEEAINAGQIEAPGYYDNVHAYARAKWIGPGRGQIDPVKEAQAAQVRMDALLSTLEDECAEQGKDWNEVIEQIAIENQRLKELGLERVALTPRVGEPGEEPAQPAQGDGAAKKEAA
jgi:capsid protein